MTSVFLRFAASLLLVASGAATCGALASGAAAQPLPPAAPDTTAASYGASTALVLRLDEYGFGLGASARTRLTDDLSISFEASAGAGRDVREQQFFVGFFGDTVTPFKRNYAMIVPLHIGLEQRLFRQSVEANFRPFAAVSGGPVLALQWPYFEDTNRNGLRETNEDRLGVFGGLGDSQPRLGFGGSAALGAYFGRGTRKAQGLRFSFIGHYFPAEVDLLELDPEVENPSQHWFLTPTVSFHIVRLMN